LSSSDLGVQVLQPEQLQQDLEVAAVKPLLAESGGHGSNRRGVMSSTQKIPVV